MTCRFRFDNPVDELLRTQSPMKEKKHELWSRIRLFRMRKWLDGVYVNPAFNELVFTTFRLHWHIFGDISKMDYLLEEVQSVIIEKEQKQIFSKAHGEYLQILNGG